jgi:uncharacterized alpha-E superfamily protein
MSRYIERAENNARIAEVNIQMLLDLTNQQEPDPNQQWDPIISSLEVNELVHFALSKSRWPGRARFCQSAKEKSKLNRVVPDARP